VFKNIFVLLLISLQLFAQEKNVLLELDTKGHTSNIWDIIVTKDKKQFITASTDKSIKIWDIKSAKEVRRIDGEVKKGSAGTIYAIALSPDEKYLAVAGFLDTFNGSNYTEIGKIRIYDFLSGRLIKVLYGHEESVFDLAFSDDGKYLASASEDNRIWDVENDFNLVTSYKIHDDVAYAIKIVKRDDEYFVYSGAHDNFLIEYSLKREEIVHSLELEDKIYYFCMNEKHIATYANNSNDIQIYDHALNFIKSFDVGLEPQVITYSPSGRYLFVAGSSSPYNQQVFDSKEPLFFGDTYEKVSTFKKHTNSVQAAAFIDEKTIVSGGGDSQEIYIWNTLNAKLKKKIKGVSSSIWSVGINEKTIGFRKKYLTSCQVKNHKGELETSFNLDDFSLSTHTFNLEKISNKYKNYTLQHKRGGDYNYKDAILVLNDGENNVTVIERGATDGHHHKVYGFYNKYIISGGSSGRVYIYDYDGEVVASLIGHESTIWSLAIDNDILVTGSNDQRMMIWDLSTLEEKMYPVLTFFVTNDNEWILYDKDGYSISSVEGDNYLGYHINNGPLKEAEFVHSKHYFNSRYDKKRIINTISNLYAKRNTKVSRKNFNPNVKPLDNIAPTLYLIDTDYSETDKKRVTIIFEIKNTNQSSDIVVTTDYRNSVFTLIDKQKGVYATRYTIEVPLIASENFIQVFAKTSDLLSKPLSLDVHSQAAYNNQKSTLHIISIGVDNVLNPMYNLEHASSDAKAVAEVIEKQSASGFQTVHKHLVINENVRKKSLDKLFKNVQKEVKNEDILIMFIAGSFIKKEDGKNYLLLKNGDMEFLEIKEFITSLNAKVILFADTLHVKSSELSDNTYLLKDLDSETSKSYLSFASTFSNISIENSKHGIYAQAILDTFNSFKYSGDISVLEIDKEIAKRVQKDSKDKQKVLSKLNDMYKEIILIEGKK